MASLNSITSNYILLKKKLKENQWLVIIIFIGLALRLVFYFFGAEIFYGKENFHEQGDTNDFFLPVYNLIEHGIFSNNLEHPKGVIGREPGYPFFIGLFYLLAGKNYVWMCYSVIFSQILLDTICVFLLYIITKSIFKNTTIALTTSFLYSTYPFIIVWTPILYAEALGVALVVFIIYTLRNTRQGNNFFIVGIVIALGVFVRPQIIFTLPAIILSLLILHRKNLQKGLKPILYCSFGFILTYGAWPIRNYFLYDQLFFFKDVSSTRDMQDDRLNFARYMQSMQTDWEPQATQLITNKEVVFPKEAFISKNDSIKLLKALNLSKTCSNGFAAYMQKPLIPKDVDCTEETAKLWKELKLSQIKNNPFNYYVKVPLNNLKKAIFKFRLYINYKSPNRSDMTTTLTTLLFMWRSLLICLSILGFLFLFTSKHHYDLLIIWVILTFFVFWYFYLCFVYRDMDIRYLLPVDVLLLIPASFTLYRLYVKINSYRIT